MCRWNGDIVVDDDFLKVMVILMASQDLCAHFCYNRTNTYLLSMLPLIATFVGMLRKKCWRNMQFKIFVTPTDALFHPISTLLEREPDHCIVSVVMGVLSLSAVLSVESIPLSRVTAQSSCQGIASMFPTASVVQY